MWRAVRSVAMVAGAVWALSSCGLLSGFVPDQVVEGGVLGLGDGVQVELVPGDVGTALVATPTAVTWVGSLEGSFDFDGLDASIPSFVSPDAITETIELGPTIVVRNPAPATDGITVTGLAVDGTFTLGSQVYAVPADLAVDGLSVEFANPSCVDDDGDEVCTYTTASSPPGVDLAFTAQQVAAFWSLLRANGGTVAVDLTITVSLAEPGLPTAATVTVTIVSGGATIEF